MNHPELAADFVARQSRTHWHDNTLWFVRSKRDKAAQSMPEWETLRETAGEIKAHTMSRLADYLEQFEREATRLGCVVHWAADAEEHNQIVLEILQRHAARRVVKSKSMLTEECHLNPFLAEHGIEVIDTDLGERIVQLAGTPPSHIVLPAIHLKKEDVGQLFHEHLGTAAGASDPKYLAEVARGHLRDKFMKADAGITGVNFAVAETGGPGDLHQRRECRPGRLAAQAAHRLAGDRKADSPGGRPGGVSAAAGPLGHRPADHHLFVAFSRPAGRRRAAHRAGRQRADRADGQRGFSPLAALHSLRRLHEHLPGLSPQRRVQLSEHGAGSDRFDPGAGPRSGEVSQLAVCLQFVRLVHGRLSGEDRFASSVAHLAGRDRPRRPFGADEAAGDESRQPGVAPAVAVPAAGRLARRIVPRLPRLLVYNRFNPWGRQRELPRCRPASFREQYRKRHVESRKNSNGHP